ncbi:MAG: DUF2254 domain-containing protein [Rhizobiaceae bacterium]|nr:DUF2254 domain-containing protein [Rhizobiaceae bacterium]
MAFLKRLINKTGFVLMTIPSVIVLVIGLLPLLTSAMDRQFTSGLLDPANNLLALSSTENLLSATATGAMTALSLAYSIALVVYSLAAGNIGPRLLKRFTTELVPQVTAGVFGGTFLYCLHTMIYVKPDFIPKLTIAGVALLATLCVIQLIFFVREIAKNITIDEEIAEITASLINDLSLQQEAESMQDDKAPDENDFGFVIDAGRSGYINHHHTKQLVKLAAENDLVIKLERTDGEFVLHGTTLLSLNRDVDDELVEDLQAAIEIGGSRSESQNVEFSIRLLIEIALRALSPGVNDTYTAIAVVDGLSKAIATIAGEERKFRLFLDQEGECRVYQLNRSTKEVIGIAFHSLRRATTNNILMAQAIAKGYTRLHESGTADVQSVIEEHADLLLKEINKGDHQKEDIESVEAYLAFRK